VKGERRGYGVKGKGAVAFGKEDLAKKGGFLYESFCISEEDAPMKGGKNT